MVVADGWLLLLITFDYLHWCFCWCYSLPSSFFGVIFVSMDGWAVPSDLRHADILLKAFRSGPAIWNWSRKDGTVILWRPGFWFRYILWCWYGMVADKRWGPWHQQTKSDGNKSFNMELCKNMACWRGLFCHGEDATIIQLLRYQLSYAVDVVKVVDRKKWKIRRSDTHGQLRKNWCLLVEGPYRHAIMDRKWCHFAWTPR